MFFWLISAGNRAETDGEPVPAVDCHDRGCDVHDFLFIEMLSHDFINFIRDLRRGNLRDRLRPSQRGAFFLGEKRCLAPGVERVNPLLGFALGAGVLRVHVETIGAAVDLRGADFYQFQQLRLDAAGADVFFERAHRFDGAGRDLGIFNS